MAKDGANPAEGAVDWDAATNYLTGGNTTLKPDDAEGTDAQTTDSEVREFSYRGKKIKVSADDYAALEELRKEARGANGRLGSQLAAANERLAKLEGMLTAREGGPTPTDPDIKEPDPALAVKDVAAWQREYTKYHEAKQQVALRRQEQRFLELREQEAKQAAEAANVQRWANEFYSTYAHLNNDHIKPIVSATYVRHKAQIDQIEATEGINAAYETLAELADAALVQVRGTGKEVGRPPRLESSAGPAPRASKAAPYEPFSTAKWVARERAKMQGRLSEKE